MPGSPPGGPTPTPWQTAPVEPAGRRAGIATAAMVCGIAGLVLCFLFVPSVVALVLGLVAAGRIKASGGRLTGLAMARAGWITGLVGVLVGVGFVIAAVAGVITDDEVAVFDLEEGDCVEHDFLDDELVEIRSMTVVDCDEPHDGIVVLTGELNPDGDAPYPDSDAELFRLIDDRCEPSLGTLDPDEYFTGQAFPIGPDRDAWDELDGPFVCIAVRPDAVMGA